jgi:hypothetical protein
MRDFHATGGVISLFSQGSGAAKAGQSWFAAALAHGFGRSALFANPE